MKDGGEAYEGGEVKDRGGVDSTKERRGSWVRGQEVKYCQFEHPQGKLGFALSYCFSVQVPMAITNLCKLFNSWCGTL